MSTGCASFEKTSYRTLASVAVSVDQAMMAWGDYVKAGFATPDSQVRVKEKYSLYQRSMAAAKAAKVAYDNDKSNPNMKSYQIALDVIAVASAGVIGIISEITNGQ